MGNKTEPNDEIINLIDSIAEELEMPQNVVTVAEQILHSIYQEELYHGRTSEQVIAGTLHLSCRQSNHPQKPEDLANMLEVKQEKLLASSRHFMKKLGLEVDLLEPEPYIENFFEEINEERQDAERERNRIPPVKEEVLDTALDVSEAGKRNNELSGKSPTGYAASSLYAASKLESSDLTQKEVAEAADVSTVTIRSSYRDLHRAYEEEFVEEEPQEEQEQ